jgi:sulfur carrier protein
MIQVRVNGRERAFDTPPTVAELLEALGVRPDGVAVAVDRQVVPRSRYPEQTVTDGQEVEVLRAVGGG